MNETLRCLGVKFDLRGSDLLEKLINREITVEELVTKDVEDVMEAWESRTYIPYHQLKNAINSKPGHLENETQEQYDRRHIERIVHILQDF